MELAERCDLLDQYIAEGRLLRDTWQRVEDGRQYACLLTAISPEALDIAKSGAWSSPAFACPASVMPRWFADLVPWLDDAGSLAKWPSVIRRFAASFRRPRSPEDWEALETDIQARVAKFMLIWIAETAEYKRELRAIYMWLRNGQSEALRLRHVQIKRLFADGDLTDNQKYLLLVDALLERDFGFLFCFDELESHTDDVIEVVLSALEAQ